MELIEHPEKNGNVLIDVSHECTASPLRRRAYVNTHLLLLSHGAYTYRRGRRRVHDGAHVVLQRGHGGRRAVPAQHEALQRPQRVRVLGRLPHLGRRQQGDRRPPLGRHDERRARGRFGSSARRRV